MAERRTKSSKSIKATPPPTSDQEDEVLINNPPPLPPPSFSQKALASTAHLANLLPTGTLLAFQLLTPIFTNNGSCDAATGPMTQILLLVLAASAFLACFTDSFRGQDGQIYYGFTTRAGMYLFDYPDTSSPPDLTKLKLRLVDFVHGVLSVLVFVSVVLRDRNVVTCFYPQPKHETQEVLDIVPLGVGLVCSLLFVVFPTRRHGIGFPVNNGN